MAKPGLQQAESRESQHGDPFFNLEQRGDHEGSVHPAHTDKSQPRGGSHISHAKNNKIMQLKIDQLKRKLCHAKKRQASPNSDVSSDDERDVSYRRRSRTPPSESFSYEDEHHHEWRFRSPPHRGVGNDVMSRALNQISKSPFTRKIEGARLPRRFHQPTFTIYNGNTDLVEHMSHFNQRMTIHSKDETLMCKVFPSNLEPIAMRWFDGLKVESINSFNELTQAFGSRFMTCRRVPRPLASLLSMSMQEGENLKTYSDRYWEMFNKIEGDFDEVAISTFKLGLPSEHGLKKSLTGKPVTNVCQLMDRIDKYKRVEEDQQQGKGKDKVISQEMRDFKLDRYNNLPRRDFSRTR